MTSRRPNLVFLLTDDHAAHAISAYGSVVNSTPRIDEIAQHGRLIDRLYCTNSLCSPSRASILTGTYSHINGVTTLSTPFAADQPTFISQLRQAGYRTAIVGKWHLGEGPEHEPQGFDHWAVLRDQGEYNDPVFLGPDGAETVPGYATDVITDKALEWVEAQGGGEPWAVLIWHKAPHRPWIPAARHRKLFTDPIPVPETFTDDHSGRASAATLATMGVADALTLNDLKEAPPSDLDAERLAVWKYQRYMADYLRCVAAIDENVGRVIDWLRERGEFDDTMLIYSSDQGFFLGDHGWYDKRFMYEESIRMPMLISYPARIGPGPPLTQMVTNLDLAPTILDAAGVRPHERMQGMSFLPQLTDEPGRPTRDAVYYRYFENDDASHHVLAHYGIRTEEYKLIYFYGDGLGLPGTSGHTYLPEWELYDLRADPAEMRNVFHDRAYRQVREELTVRLWHAQAEAGDVPHPSQPVPAGI